MCVSAGDVLVYVNGECVLGFTHQDVVSMFQSMPFGDVVSLEVCRGYSLPFDPNDPDTEIVTTVAVALPPYTTPGGSPAAYPGSPSRHSVKSLPDLSRPGGGASGGGLGGGAGDRRSALRNKSFEQIHVADDGDLRTVHIVKGPYGFGFTVAASGRGQRVKQVLDRARCGPLAEGDVLAEINGVCVADMPHAQLVEVLKGCREGDAASITVQRARHGEKGGERGDREGQTRRRGAVGRGGREGDRGEGHAHSKDTVTHWNNCTHYTCTHGPLMHRTQ